MPLVYTPTALMMSTLLYDIYSRVSAIRYFVMATLLARYAMMLRQTFSYDAMFDFAAACCAALRIAMPCHAAFRQRRYFHTRHVYATLHDV